MPKQKSFYVCQECGYESIGWMGKCPSCNQWNTFVEEIQEPKSKSRSGAVSTNVKPVNINDIEADTEERYLTGIKEMDRVLGGGIVKGSLILVGGDPGIGKSTLLLQICDKIKTNAKILYVSGEESIKQIKLRADRLNVRNPNLLMLSETNFKVIQALSETERPDLIVIDSIQTMFNDELPSAPGSVSQVREITSGLMRIAKTLNIAIIIVGHVTKEGAIAGPRVLEHMVDTVLYFEGERHLSYRILRAVKNRFGSTNEIGIFEMRDVGLVEVENPSSMLLSERTESVPGSVAVATLEGTRPMLIEIQALVCPTSFGMPRRMATGLDYNRITLLMAVLEKRVGMQLHNYDAYVNVVGGLKIDEPACDLGVVTAIASSFRNIPVDMDTVLIGEVGLTGEVRAVSQIDKRIREAVRIGFKNCVVPAGNMKVIKQMKDINNINVKFVENVQEALNIIL
ncbi:MAG TPA: DNA repair protein RadA [Hungateiclostridium thermocellum]|uniref:DNA repair protein RadA n=1 Tax=Acetivibrio thermocellus (strain ATCC 27405 / DSM 1237 / JCM 9322 / NBRC 103400 / NCIMB 10682 / NRRL B-4536 / VPI 7372) TaxID=203119 RepID=A3DGC8_ACET2|nr:DNA repair protein RadA [Acetivibrio thermocellus]CDG36307.1 DNA repair protein RadA homolog [Acetivibrio thermocellus BC1]ABN53007.1 DNA repair protein RadA [Acetivibrio thermocellus ATCC 27405]NLU25810.1 DNA repair protein RadA [Acetivibrio thermocellus]THJ78774.1 DNA repair protein RadA [Acetivibrio thermocellus]UWV46404.1 DNA repair protein RadA [Acetivibrio thermocellus]